MTMDGGVTKELRSWLPRVRFPIYELRSFYALFSSDQVNSSFSLKDWCRTTEDRGDGGVGRYL